MRSCLTYILPRKNGYSCRGVMLWLPVLLMCSLFLGGCGSWRLSQLWEKPQEGQSGFTPGLNRSVQSSCPLPQEPLAAPTLPTDLQGSAEARKAGSVSAQDDAQSSLPYITKFSAPKLPEAIQLLEKNSLLVRLQFTPPPDRMGLDYRISKDEAEAQNILQSLGYYSGTVQSTVDEGQKPALVCLNLDPGPLYTIGDTHITYSGKIESNAPQTLAKLGLGKDAPAATDEVLAAVDSVPQWLKAHGYPLARVDASHYYVDKENHRLDAEIIAVQGPYATMGKVVVEGTDTVSPEFLNRLRTWKEGRVWNENRLELYRNELTEQGLFRSISLEAVPAAASATSADPKEVDTAPLYDVLLRVADAPQRTIGGGLNYESDQGPGGQAFWEHRNLLGSGEHLRTELALWEEKQNARISFSKPAFLQRDQALTAEAWLRAEDTDAYFQQAAWAGAGIERRLSRFWWASVKASAEGGELRDPVHKRQGYTMFGLPLGLRFDNTRSLLDSTNGVRAKLAVTPYEGQYGKAFNALHSRLDASAYVPLTQDKRAVLAARVSTGSLMRDDALTVPASIRFYSGGGGSVRGYAYQSLGPRDSDDDPLGGASFLEMSFEARIKITETIGIVPFLDGGNAFEDRVPRPDKEALRWGAGIGFRYYTSIGPLRLDLATPVNPRKDDAPFFVYISIGQSF